MTTIHDAYINALLADATYGLVEDASEGYTGDDLKSLSSLIDRMTTPLTNFIGDNFSVVTHKETSDLASGFDATVWRDNEGNAYVSFQGTTGFADFVTDVGLTVIGVAFDQVVDMVNWWLKSTTPVGSLAKQINGFNGTVVAAPSVDGTGIISNVSEIIVNGH